ncbi:MAG: hypothetical protein RL297_983 [Pseudomonadota bacterium]
MLDDHYLWLDWVHCRIGSSEKVPKRIIQVVKVHCRIGSSENEIMHWDTIEKVHCRIGSSEK